MDGRIFFVEEVARVVGKFILATKNKILIIVKHAVLGLIADRDCGFDSHFKNAGPTFVAGLRETGPSLIFVALIVAVLPHLVALLFGYHVLKMHPVILLGACAGAGTITAALRAIQDESQSKLPVLGYTVPYAIGNILLTACGPIIVVLMQ